MKEILIINGHPNAQSYNHALAKSYQEGALTAQANVSTINIGQLDFNPSLAYGYQEKMPLEPDLVKALDKIKKAEHIVWFFPMWWYGYPAIMKGFIDRVFLPNIAFKYNNNPLPEKLFKGKTARIVVTADSPRWYSKWFMNDPAINQLKKGTLAFCGIKTIGLTYIAPIRKSTTAFRQQWLDKLYQLGTKIK